MSNPVNGVEEAARALRAVHERCEVAVRRNVKRSLLNIEGGAKRRCRVRTGRTRNAITHQVDPDGMDGTVGVDVEYAVHQHFGTGRLGSASAAEFGFTGGAYDLSLAGQAANPFLFLSSEEERPRFRENLQRDLVSELGKLVR